MPGPDDGFFDPDLLDEQDAEVLEGEVLPPERGTSAAPRMSLESPGQALALVPPPAALDRPRDGGVAADPVAAFLSRYVSPHSRRAMLASLRVVARLLTGREVEDVRGVPWATVRYPHAQAVRARLAAEYAPASANLHLGALRGVVKECWRLGLVDRDVYERITEVESLKGDQREAGRALKPEEVVALYRACASAPAGLRDAAVLALTLGGGLRRSEVVGLDLEHWDATEAKVRVLGKGNKWRGVYLPEVEAAAVGAWLALRGSEPGPLVLPVSKHGTPTVKRMTPAGLYKAFAAIGKRAGVQDFSPHDLRRTFITRLLDKGADALTVSKLAGHASVQTTMRYDRRGEAAKKAAVALLNEK